MDLEVIQVESPRLSMQRSPSTSVHAEAIDVDLLGDHEEATESRRTIQKRAGKGKVVVRRQKRLKTYLECDGLQISFPNGQNPYMAWPWAVHAKFNPPWDTFVIDNILYLRSRDCIDVVADEAVCCRKCHALLRTDVLEGILQRLEKGIHESSPYHLQPIAGLIEIAKLKGARNDQLRLLSLNEKRYLLVRVRQVEDGKRFVMAVGAGKVGRVSALVRTAKKRGASLKAICASMDKAAQDLYKPKGYEEEELLKTFVLWKFGGFRTMTVLNHASGHPSVSTVRRRFRTEPITISVSLPTVMEIKKNIRGAFRTDLPGSENVVAPGTQGFGYILQFDEIACEKRVRYDPGTNLMIGIARESSEDITGEFNSIQDANQLFDDLREGKRHLATEVSK